MNLRETMKKSKKPTHKKIFIFPVKWDWKNAFKPMWNKKSSEIFPPKNFGVGWTINFHALGKALGILKKK